MRWFFYDQLAEVWYENLVLNRLYKSCEVKTAPNIDRLDLNEASATELAMWYTLIRILQMKLSIIEMLTVSFVNCKICSI